MRKPKRLFFAYLRNKTDIADDDILKIKASSRYMAEKIAKYLCPHNYEFNRVMTRIGLKRYDQEWHRILWGVEAIDVEGIVKEYML